MVLRRQHFVWQAKTILPDNILLIYIFLSLLIFNSRTFCDFKLSKCLVSFIFCSIFFNTLFVAERISLYLHIEIIYCSADLFYIHMFKERVQVCISNCTLFVIIFNIKTLIKLNVKLVWLKHYYLLSIYTHITQWKAHINTYIHT